MRLGDDDLRQGKVVRLGRHSFDFLFPKSDAAHDGVASKLAQEAVVVAAAIAEAHVVCIEGDHRNDTQFLHRYFKGKCPFAGYNAGLSRGG